MTDSKLRFFFFGYGQTSRARGLHCLLRILWLTSLVEAAYYLIAFVVALAQGSGFKPVFLICTLVGAGMAVVFSTQLD